mgnify:FL=1
MRKFKVGEEVTVRTWEDMKKQYGMKIITPEIPKETFFGSIPKEMFSVEFILVPKKAVPDIMQPYCGRKMKISANPAPDVYVLDGAEPFEWLAEAFEEFWKEEEEPESTEVEKEKVDMPKLENGMVVELRSGKRFLVAEFFGEQFLLSNKWWCDLNDMNLKTGKSSIDSIFDIVKVIKPYCPNYLKAIKRSERIIWEAE